MYFQNTDFIFYDPNPFSAYFSRLHISLKIWAKRVGTIKNKMCVFSIQETFVLSSICQKCQGTRIKGGWKREGDCDHKTALIWVPWHFLHMLDNTKVSCMVKTHILSFMTPPLFAHILRDTCIYRKCVFLPYKKLLLYQAYAKNVRVPSKLPPPPYIKLYYILFTF